MIETNQLSALYHDMSGERDSLRASLRPGGAAAKQNRRTPLKASFQMCPSVCFAEREGFEPPVPLSTPVFKTGVIDHSTISPEPIFGFAAAKVL